MRKLDIGIAAALTAWMVAEVWAENLSPSWVAGAASIVGGAALAWRRSRPIVVMLVIIVVSVVESAAGVTMHSAVSPVVALFVVSWSIGAYEERRRAALGLVLLVCGVWLAMGVDVLRGTDHYVGTDVPWIGALIVTPGILGIAFGARTRSLRDAEGRALRLEVERREAVAEERARIARELHDVIAHSVSVMTIQAGAAEEMLKRDPARALEPVRAVQQTGREALNEMKRLVGMLREHDEETGLEPQPRLRDVGRLVAQVREAGLEVELRVEGEPRALPIGIDLSAYRVVQEGLTNALKHARGARATVTVSYREDGVAIEVSDDGSTPTQPGVGHGLIGMRERVGVFGGTFDAGPRPSGGFAVRALLPLEGGV